MTGQEAVTRSGRTGSESPGRDLSALFAPEAVTIVGASADPAKWGNAVARQALRATRRPLHLVTRGSTEVLGRPTVPSLADIDGPVGLVVVAVPAAHFETVVDEALAVGARAICAITAGLGELGEQGKAREAAVVARVRAAGAVLVGPNCLGLVDNGQELYVSSDSFDPGGVALFSQSGNLAIELSHLLAARRLGFSRFVSLGNQSDVSLADLVADTAHHEGTTAIAAYVEDFGDGRAFVQAAHLAAEAGKPLVLLANGGEAAARSAQSHTGSLASSSDVIRAACDAAGAVHARTPRQLADLLLTLSRAPRMHGHRVAVLTDGGGHGTIASDAIESYGMSVPVLSAELGARLIDDLWEKSAVVNPVDLAGVGEQDLMTYARGVDRLLGSDEVDAVLLTGYFGGYSTPSAFGQGLGDEEVAAAQAILRSAAAADKPLVVQSMFPQSPSVQVLRDAGLPVFDAVEDAAWSLSKLYLAHELDPVAPLPAPLPPLAATDYVASRAAIAAVGVPVVPAAEVVTQADVRAAAASFPGPYVLKANGLLHKSDLGGVVLGLPDVDALVAAHADVVARLSPPSCTVEAMADLSAGVEIIVGVRQDPRFGPVALVGLGGVFTEVLRDTALALAPVTAARARELLMSLRGADLLTGTRGRAAVDLDAAARTVEQLTTLAAAHPEWTEFEVNPLLLTASGVLALDARIVLDADESDH